MKTMNLNGTEVVTLGEIAKAIGTTSEALRVRRTRGTISLEPLYVIGTTQLFSADVVRSLFREALEVSQ